MNMALSTASLVVLSMSSFVGAVGATKPEPELPIITYPEPTAFVTVPEIGRQGIHVLTLPDNGKPHTIPMTGDITDIIGLPPGLAQKPVATLFPATTIAVSGISFTLGPGFEDPKWFTSVLSSALADQARTPTLVSSPLSQPSAIRYLAPTPRCSLDEHFQLACNPNPFTKSSPAPGARLTPATATTTIFPIKPSYSSYTTTFVARIGRGVGLGYTERFTTITTVINDRPPPTIKISFNYTSTSLGHIYRPKNAGPIAGFPGQNVVKKMIRGVKTPRSLQEDPITSIVKDIINSTWPHSSQATPRTGFLGQNLMKKMIKAAKNASQRSHLVQDDSRNIVNDTVDTTFHKRNFVNKTQVHDWMESHVDKKKVTIVFIVFGCFAALIAVAGCCLCCAIRCL